jgi:hypothetical protein
MTPIFTKTLVRASHVRRFEITPLPASGWEVSACEDQRVLDQRQYRDWHRVERARMAFVREVVALEREGWVEQRRN